MKANNASKYWGSQFVKETCEGETNLYVKQKESGDDKNC